MIHIIDGQSDELVGVITENEVLFNTHKQSLENQLEQFDFECLPDFYYADKLTDRNRLIIPSEDKGYIEFIIQNAIKTNDRVEVYTTASYLDLIKAKVINPTVLESTTATSALSFVTNETEWRPGLVESDTLRTITIDAHTNPFTTLKRVADEFDLELRFRTETNGNRVTNRYVDLLDRVGTWDGREITFGKDLDTIERSEDMSNIYTALLCLGPEDAEGNRLEVLVEDADALQRWGRPDPITGELKHLIGIYEPQSERLDMTLSELEQYGRAELDKRINAVITYSANIVDLEHVPGMENKKIRFGDTIRIKDEKFSPPLYIEARVFEQSRDIFENSLKEVKLGDFVEFTEEQVTSAFKLLQQQIREKISESELRELTYDKPTIDNKDTQVKTDAEQDATQKAQQAISVSKDHADQVASDAESNANNYTNTVKSQIDAELLDKAGLEYVDGQLALKADSALVNTINNTVAGLETTASNLQQAVTDNEVALNAQGGRITTVETDLNTVEGQLSVAITDLSSLEGVVSSQSTQISANSSAISLKANQSELDTVSGNVSDLSGELNVLAGQVELKASQSALTNLADDVTQISSDVSSLQIGVNGITADVGSLETTVNGHTTDISSLNSQFTVQAGQISLKADSTTVDSMNTRLSTAETDINALDGAITSKVETSTFNTLEGRVDTAESTISQQANQIQSKIDDGQARSIFTQEADSFTFDADQINFVGHVFGQDATFTGAIEGSEIIAPDIKSSESSQSVLWFNSAADYFGEGSIGAQENRSDGLRQHFLAGRGIYALNDDTGSVMYSDSRGSHWHAMNMDGSTFPGLGISMLDVDTGSADMEINATGNVYVSSPLYAQGYPVETVVSTGSNSKGHWIKYSSGKMEVWCTPIATTCENTSGNVYRSDVFDVDFPQNFNDSHPISVALNVTAAGRWADIVSSPSSTGCRAHQYSTVHSTSNFSAFVYAVGMALVL